MPWQGLDYGKTGVPSLWPLHPCGLYDAKNAAHCAFAPMAIVLVVYFPGFLQALRVDGIGGDMRHFQVLCRMLVSGVPQQLEHLPEGQLWSLAMLLGSPDTGFVATVCPVVKLQPCSRALSGYLGFLPQVSLKSSGS